MRYINNKIRFIVAFNLLFTMSCENFVELDTPDHILVSPVVFNSGETATAAIKGIYNELADADFSRGYQYSVTVLAGMPSDIFETTSVTDTRYGPFQQNEIAPAETPDASANYNLWSSAYNVIYMANSALEGLENSTNIPSGQLGILEGRALFLRAFTYFYLTNLYGDVPLVLTTDYRQNSVATRNPASEVWDQLMDDLEEAVVLLDGQDFYGENERTNINQYVVQAFLARVYLYREDWKKAEELSSKVIYQTSIYEILEDLDQVFLKNSKEAIWQISPEGRGFSSTYTGDGYMFRGNSSSPVKLSDNFVASMQEKDKRLANWVGFNSSRSFHFPYKYKDSNSRNSASEYSMVLRLAEQYLIRAESRAMQGNISGAIADVDVLRSRAGLDLINDIEPGINKEALLNIISEERKLELFSEWGHRWFDLKRTGKAAQVLMPIKPLWQETDVLFPIPQVEIDKNQNLHQNVGY